MTTRETVLLGLIGFSIWLSGAVGFRFAGALLFESGPLWLGVVAIVVAATVCLLLKAIMDWRKLTPALSAQAAAALAWPGLLADAAYALGFSTITGLDQATAGNFAAVIMTGNAALLAYAVMRTVRATS